MRKTSIWNWGLNLLKRFARSYEFFCHSFCYGRSKSSWCFSCQLVLGHIFRFLFCRGHSYMGKVIRKRDHIMPGRNEILKLPLCTSNFSFPLRGVQKCSITTSRGNCPWLSSVSRGTFGLEGGGARTVNITQGKSERLLEITSLLFRTYVRRIS